MTEPLGPVVKNQCGDSAPQAYSLRALIHHSYGVLGLSPDSVNSVLFTFQKMVLEPAFFRYTVYSTASAKGDQRSVTLVPATSVPLAGDTRFGPGGRVPPEPVVKVQTAV